MSTIDIEAIATAWQDFNLTYGEEYAEYWDEEYLQDAFLSDGTTKVIRIGEPTMTEQRILQRIAAARGDIEALAKLARAAAVVIDLVVEEGTSWPALDAAMAIYLELRYGPPDTSAGATVVRG